MPDKIEPALSAEEWASLGPNGVGHPPMPSTLDDIQSLDVDDLPKAVAIANAILPDDDTRKITRHTIWIIRTLLRDAYIDPHHPGALRFKAEAEQLADALESYLPPEGEPLDRPVSSGI